MSGPPKTGHVGKPVQSAADQRLRRYSYRLRARRTRKQPALRNSWGSTCCTLLCSVPTLKYSGQTPGRPNPVICSLHAVRVLCRPVQPDLGILSSLPVIPLTILSSLSRNYGVRQYWRGQPRRCFLPLQDAEASGQGKAQASQRWRSVA